MPTVLTILNAPSHVVSYYSDGTYDTYPAQQNLWQSVLLTRPIGSKRVRPKDLFGNATAWYVESSLDDYNRCTLTEVLSSTTTRVTEAQASYWSSMPGFTPTQDFARADLKMRLRIKDQKVDLPVMISEIGQTAAMLTGLSKDLVAAFKQLKRGHPIAAVRRILSDPKTRADRALANRWLELSFGVLPTMSDIYGLAEASSTRLHQGFYVHQKVAVAEDQQVQLSHGIMDVTRRIISLHKVRCRYKYSSTALPELARFGITNPASFLWEKTAWSFAIDWAINVGDFLAGLDALLGVTDLVVLRSYGFDVNSNGKLPPSIKVSGGVAATSNVKIRARLTPGSDLSFGSPRVTSIFDTGALGMRLANASALLRQITGKPR